MKTGYNLAARKRPVNLTLNEDLVLQARGITDNLSGVVESLLADFVEHERQQRLAKTKTLEATVAIWNDFNAKFGSHRNTGKSRDDIPYVVLVQSSLFDGYRRRVVVPLVRKSTLGKISNARFNPAFKIEGITVVLHPLEIVSAPIDRLGEPVASLAHEGGRIMDALDELLTRAWG